MKSRGAGDDLDMTNILLRRVRVAPEWPLQDVLVMAGRVTGVGPIGPSTEVSDVIDLDGRFVLPGLWDRHVHFEQWALATARLDLSGTETAAAAVQSVSESIATHPPTGGASVFGFGFRAALWPIPPDREMLDAVSADIPVVLISADLHSAWLNSAALRRYGQAAHPTGLLREDEAMQVIGASRNVGDSVLDGWCDAASRAAAARGVVGIVDMERPWSLAAWERRIAGGNHSLRVAASVWTERLGDAIAHSLRTGQVVPGTNGLLTVGPFKVITDGSLNTRTAFCHEPYAASNDGGDGRGVFVVPPEELSNAMRRAADAGFECAVHAIGDAANALVLDAFARTGARGSVEHAQLLDDDDVQRFAGLRVIASVQPAHLLDDRDVIDRYWSDRARRAFPFRSLLDAGATLAFGSDAPVAPLDPWLAIAAAVHRSSDERPRWHPEQEITIHEALLASMPPGRGDWQLRAGDPADLIVLDRDPFAAEPALLRTMPVAATMLGGEWTHRSGI
jgi:predicted amidohydrolase YtcJ